MPDADPPVSPPDTDRQYHIDLAPGEVADYILLPGDPDRTDRIASLLDQIEVQRRHREFHSVTGSHRGLRISVVSTGIGADNVEIVMAEILAITRRPTFVRIGSCGALREDIAIGDLVITTGALRLEATTSYYVEDGYPAVADYAAVAALLEAAARTGQRAHLGLTATAPGFYGAQGRPIPHLPLRFPDLAAAHGRAGRRELRDGGLSGPGPGGPGGLPRGRRVHRLRAAHQRRVRLRRAAASGRGGAHGDRPRGAPRAGRDGRAAVTGWRVALASVTLGAEDGTLVGPRTAT